MYLSSDLAILLLGILLAKIKASICNIIFTKFTEALLQQQKLIPEKYAKCLAIVGMVQLCCSNIHTMDCSVATDKNELSLCVET